MKKYLPINPLEESAFAFSIEDPVSSEFNPGYSVILKSPAYNSIIYEFQRAYQALASKKVAWFCVPVKY